MNKYHCENCGKEMIPAPAKKRADGEQTYCGYFPCPCERNIMTDFGLVHAGTEEHKILIETGNYSIGDLR